MVQEESMSEPIFHREYLGEKSYCAGCRVALVPHGDTSSDIRFKCPECGLVARLVKAI